MVSLNRKRLFNLAAELLGFPIHEETTKRIGGQFQTVIRFGVPCVQQHGQDNEIHIYGEITSTEHFAIQTAYQNGLEYLENQKMFKIHDYSANTNLQSHNGVCCDDATCQYPAMNSEPLSNKIEARIYSLCNILSSVDGNVLSKNKSLYGSLDVLHKRLGSILYSTSILDEEPQCDQHGTEFPG